MAAVAVFSKEPFSKGEPLWILSQSTDLSILLFLSVPEYDRHLAAAVKAGKTMATAYLDPNLNHAFLGGAKSRLSAGGSDRMATGSVDRVLKVFHHFETNNEQNIWSSNIRYGDATDVRVREGKQSYPDKCWPTKGALLTFSALDWCCVCTHRTHSWCL